MDEHFRTSAVREQLAGADGPDLGLWYNDFFDARRRLAVLPYSQYLDRFSAYLQQLVHGEQRQERSTRDGQPVQVADRPGGLGPARHQRAARVLPADPPGHASSIPADFIGCGQAPRPRGRHGMQDLLLSPTSSRRPRLSRSARLRRRSPPRASPPEPCAAQDLRPATDRRPRLLVVDRLTPSTLGQLVATVRAQGASPRARSGASTAFDQWGVELGKVMASQLAPLLTGDVEPVADASVDSSTAALARRLRAGRR